MGYGVKPHVQKWAHPNDGNVKSASFARTVGSYFASRHILAQDVRTGRSWRLNWQSAKALPPPRLFRTYLLYIAIVMGYGALLHVQERVDPNDRTVKLAISARTATPEWRSGTTCYFHTRRRQSFCQPAHALAFSACPALFHYHSKGVWGETPCSRIALHPTSTKKEPLQALFVCITFL